MTLLAEYEGDAFIVRGDERTFARVDYRVEQDVIYPGIDGLRSWGGTFRAADLIPFDPAAATLELPDGRRGMILIVALETLDVTSLGSTWRDHVLGSSGRFEGNGQAPQ